MSHKYATAALFAAGAFAAPAPAPQASGTASAASNEPSEFTANPNVGAGGDTFTDSPRFRVYGATGDTADTTLQMLESAYTCFVTDLGWRSSGLSYNSDSDTAETWYKENIYSVASLDGGAAGVMGSDPETGLSFVQVVNTYLTDPSVTVHEYGHALTYHAQNWVDQTATGAWWEPLANWFADTFITSDLCASAREKYSQETGDSVIELQKVIGDSYQVIVDGSVDSGNYYQSWPVLTYLTNNPDNYTGLGNDAVLRLSLEYEVGSNETPLHTLQRLLGDGATVAQVVGRYWAHMAYVDIGSEAANRAFLEQRETLAYDNLDGSGESYTVKAARQPQYFGANINPIKASGGGSVSVTVKSDKAFTATLAVRDTDAGSVRYVDLENGSGEATVGGSEEASLVVVNAPKELLQYDPFDLSSEAKAGLDYTVQITGGSF
ncbi:uncharacterized protein APUU_31325S [Aspergillus puulaauensis]|uniref:Dockerin type 1 n=1 Tax=Aspergillus puulaauensis TaxID=1220207 RepID=A0A7R7XM44_9EURO|nr:uncharacterized protein APUU_31325S [Aspergillus puulaauensis]BCS23099.1 hypothetical protein APUU_31325S [Aspergillus puulaauensis]